MIFKFKEYPLSNSLNVFNYYKEKTGTSLEKDIRLIDKYKKVMDNPNSSQQEIDAISDIDIIAITQMIYYSMRCAAEKKELDFSLTIDEVDINDLADGSLQEALMKLVDVKKKQEMKQGLLSVLKRHK